MLEAGPAPQARDTAPLLVALHFLGSNAAQWAPTFERLADRFRLLALDLPGFGSAASVRGRDVAGMAEFVAAEIRRRSPGRWLMVGHSMGAKVACAVARMAEDGAAGLDGLTHLVLVAGSPPGPEPMEDGKRTVFFELNGQPREVEVVDRSLASAVREAPKADPADPNQVAAPLPGLVVGVGVNVGDAVRKGQKLLTIEAMKMETTLYAERPGKVVEVLAKVGAQCKTGDLLVELEPEGPA